MEDAHTVTMDPRQAFKLVNALHRGVDVESVQPFQDPNVVHRVVALDYLRASLEFLAEKFGSPTIRPMASASLQVIDEVAVETVVTSNMTREAIRMGMPALIAARQKLEGATPRLLLPPNGGRHILIVPLSFVVMARSTPVEALSHTVWTCSVVFDWFNGRFSIDRSSVPIRARASQAEYWLHVASLGISELAPGEDLLTIYPEGLSSLSPVLNYHQSNS